MKLYHGTTEAIAQIALKEGLRPRSQTKRSNWKHSVESNPKCIYLTNCYPLYFAAMAVDELAEGEQRPRLAVIEIETDWLNPLNLFPDEDVLEQAGRNNDDLPKDWDMKRRTRHYRRHMFDYGSPSWEKSIEAMGTCAHRGTIPPHAIARIAYVDYIKQAHLCWTALNAFISLANYRHVGGQYRQMTNFLFGEPVNYKDLDPFWDVDPLVPDEHKETFAGVMDALNGRKQFWTNLFANRDGIELVTVNGKR